MGCTLIAHASLAIVLRDLKLPWPPYPRHTFHYSEPLAAINTNSGSCVSTRTSQQFACFLAPRLDRTLKNAIALGGPRGAVRRFKLLGLMTWKRALEKEMWTTGFRYNWRKMEAQDRGGWRQFGGL